MPSGISPLLPPSTGERRACGHSRESRTLDRPKGRRPSDFSLRARAAMLCDGPMNKLALGFAVLSCSAFAAACSSANDEEATKAAEAPLVADASSMVQRADGRWDVVCKNGTTQVVTTAQILANDVCAATPMRCVPKCMARYSDGSCRTFGPDFCGAGATCVATVTSRYSDGSPKDYGPDFCNAGPAVCGVQCTERYSDGSCKTYGPDVCGAAAAKCVLKCSDRYSDGSCRTYAADFCKQGLPAPACLVNCTNRYSDGSCRTYGADICQ